VDIPVDEVKAERRRSLYKDLFGTDLSVVAEAYDAPWASREQRTLASAILDGRKSINNLSTSELELLDDLAVRFNDQGGELNEAVRQADSERLLLPEQAEARRQADQEVQPGDGSDLQPDVSEDIKRAYGWTGEGEEDGDE
jgi:hypothetical protein